MRDAEFTLEAEDGSRIHVYRWLPDDDASTRAVVLIAHGMGEHAARYAPLAKRLTEAGYAVYAPDQRGHGRTAPSREELGHLGDSGGWSAAVADLLALNRRAREDLPGRPIVLLGHSMGAMLAQQYLIEHGDTLAAAALSGAAGDPGAIRRLGLWLGRLERLRVGRRGESALLRWLTFGRANRLFEPARTPFDWLSRDRHEVAAYVADPYCGFSVRVQSFCEMMQAVGWIHAPASLERIPKQLPIYVFSGEEDPVHEGLKRLRRMLAAFEAAGLERVTQRIYERGRHEMLNEVNRVEVEADLLAWLEKALPASATG